MNSGCFPSPSSLPGDPSCHRGLPMEEWNSHLQVGTALPAVAKKTSALLWGHSQNPAPGGDWESLAGRQVRKWSLALVAGGAVSRSLPDSTTCICMVTAEPGLAQLHLCSLWLRTQPAQDLAQDRRLGVGSPEGYREGKTKDRSRTACSHIGRVCSTHLGPGALNFSLCAISKVNPKFPSSMLGGSSVQMPSCLSFLPEQAGTRALPTAWSPPELFPVTLEQGGSGVDLGPPSCTSKPWSLTFLVMVMPE